MKNNSEKYLKKRNNTLHIFKNNAVRNAGNSVKGETDPTNTTITILTTTHIFKV
jgi:hypothetical protein